MRLAKSQRAVLLASLLLYLGSLLFPAVEYDAMSSQPAIHTTHLWHAPLGQVETVPGYFHLALGWIGMLLPPQITPLGWLANPAFFLVLLAARWEKIVVARVSAVASLALAACSLVLVNMSPMHVLLHDPVPQYWSAIRPLAGFWLWLAAIATLNVYAFLLRRPAAGSADTVLRAGNSSARSRSETVASRAEVTPPATEAASPGNEARS